MIERTTFDWDDLLGENTTPQSKELPKSTSLLNEDDFDSMLDEIMEEDSEYANDDVTLDKDGNRSVIEDNSDDVDITEEEELELIQKIARPAVKAPKGAVVDYSKVDGKEVYKFTMEPLHKLFAKAESPKAFYASGVISYHKPRYIENPFTDEKTSAISIGNGLTVADYFVAKRAGKVGSETYDIIKNKALEALHNGGKVDETNPYKNRIVYETDTLKMTNKLSATSERNYSLKMRGSDFVRKFQKQTPHQKRILKAMGLTLSELDELVSPRSILTPDEKIKLLALSGACSKGKKRGSYKGSVKSVDYSILEFIDKVRLASLGNLIYATGSSRKHVIYRKMMKLRNLGLVSSVLLYNHPGVWRLTTTGLALIGSDKGIPSSKQAGLSSMAERVYVNHVAACIHSGCINILNEDEFPKMKRLDKYTGEYVQGENFIYESEIFSDMYKFRTELCGNIYVKDTYKGETMQRLRDSWEIAWRDWEQSGKHIEASPELSRPWLYTLWYRSPYDGFTKNYVLPDIVVPRGRNADGSPNSIAIEVEKSGKDNELLLQKLRMYQMDYRLFAKVIFVTSSNRIAKNIQECAERIGFDRYDIVPMQIYRGVTKETNGWLLGSEDSWEYYRK